MVFSGEFILEWKDVFLWWNPSEYNNLTWLKLKEQLIWRPDVTVSTSISKSTLLEENERYLDVRFDGLVRQSLFGVYTNLCNMQVDRFPYDYQNCMIEVGPWSYTEEEIYCYAGPTKSNDSFQGNSEWDYVDLHAFFARSTDQDVGFNYTTIQFWLKVKRRPLFYVWVLLIPTFIITTVCICGLFMPTNSIGDREEKVNLGLSTLLSSAVILEIVAASMPKTSALPLLGNFILAEIFVVAIGVLCSVLVLVIHNRAHTREWQPPRWVLAVLRMSGSSKFLRASEPSRKKSAPLKYVPVYKGEGSKIIAEMDMALENLTQFVTHEKRLRMGERVCENKRAQTHCTAKSLCRTCNLTWLKFFDRIDFVLLVIFLAGNSLLTWIVCK